MAVSINGFGPTTTGLGLVDNGRTGEVAERNRESRGQTVQVREERLDRVEISQEAADLAQAEKTARDVSRQLANNKEQYLGLNPDFDEAG